MCAGACAPAHYTKKKAKMKKTYFTPEFVEIELKLQGALLAESETTGGGINDDNTGNKGEGEGDPSDLGW